MILSDMLWFITAAAVLSVVVLPAYYLFAVGRAIYILAAGIKQ